MEGLTKILRICSRNGYFHAYITKDSLTSIQYGPLGSLLKRNIRREWLSSVINNADVCMFPLEVQLLRNSPNQLLQSPERTADFFSVILKNYFELDPVVGSDIPWGFAAYGSLGLWENNSNSEVILNNSLLSNYETKFHLGVAFFCSMKKSSDWFNYWARYRYRWWRKFSSIPSKFFMSDVTETDAGNQQISLVMEFPWGKEKLESVTLYSDEFFKKWISDLDLKKENEIANCKSSFIFSHSELDLAVLAYINNSYAEKWRDGEIRNLLQLHNKLAPYKIAILVDEGNSADLIELKNVAKHLEKEFKTHKVAIFPCLEDLKKEDSLQFSRYDEMGVPYTVVLSKKALHSGIAGIRNRDTTLEEQVHITELTPKLLKYLQMKSYGVDEF